MARLRLWNPTARRARKPAAARPTATVETDVPPLPTDSTAKITAGVTRRKFRRGTVTSFATEQAPPSLAILGTRGIPASHGGFETFAEQLATHLVRRGWKVTVYCQEQGQGATREDTWNNIQRVLIPTRSNGAVGTVVSACATTIAWCLYSAPWVPPAHTSATTTPTSVSTASSRPYPTGLSQRDDHCD